MWQENQPLSKPSPAASESPRDHHQQQGREGAAGHPGAGHICAGLQLLQGPVPGPTRGCNGSAV